MAVTVEYIKQVDLLKLNIDTVIQLMESQAIIIEFTVECGHVS